MVFVDALKVKERVNEGAQVRIIDCRFDLMNAAAGERAFVEGHIEGAVYMHLERDLSDMTKVASGRHPMPDKSQLVQVFQSLGLTVDQEIYCYDDGAQPFAARAYWMLTYAGFRNVFIVNGGIEALVQAGFNVTADVTQYERSVIEPVWQEDIYATRSDVFQVTQGEKEAVLVDARAAKRFSGEFEPLDPVAGHIPGARNFDWEQLKEEKSLVVTEALLKTVPRDETIVVYCGSGVTASPLYATLKEAGYTDVKLYVGSYSDWINEHEVE